MPFNEPKRSHYVSFFPFASSSLEVLTVFSWTIVWAPVYTPGQSPPSLTPPLTQQTVIEIFKSLGRQEEPAEHERWGYSTMSHDALMSRESYDRSLFLTHWQKGNCFFKKKGGAWMCNLWFESNFKTTGMLFIVYSELCRERRLLYNKKTN